MFCVAVDLTETIISLIRILEKFNYSKNIINKMASHLKNQNDNHMNYHIDNTTKDERYELAEAKNAARYKKHMVEKIKHFMDQSNLNDCDESTDEEYEHIIKNLKTYVPKLPDSLLFLIPGALYRGDCGRSATDRPPWLNISLFRKGQKIAQEYIFSIFIANMLSLFQIFVFADGLKPMILSRQSHTPYLAFKRYVKL